MSNWKAILPGNWNWKSIRLFFSLLFFGLVIGVLAALNTNVGATTALVAALFGLVGGSLITLYNPPVAGGGGGRPPAAAPSPAAASNVPREEVILAAGIISLGMLLGLVLGFWLRYHDEGWLKMDLIRQRAETDRELRKYGQHLGQFMGAAEGEGGKAKEDKGTPDDAKDDKQPKVSAPRSLVELRVATATTVDNAKKELGEAISRLLRDKKSSGQDKVVEELKTFNDAIFRDWKQPTLAWFAHVAHAEAMLKLLGEASAADALGKLRKEASSPSN